ncbi:MAG: recombinase family protein [Burkholderiales bacterium]|nr:recombinase family protein [Burkholderiales bacterium]
MTKQTAAVYLRVSRGEQEVSNQRPDVERLVRARGLELVEVYEERASAAVKRPELERLLRAAHAGTFEVLVVWSLDRLGRSMVGNLQTVLELDRRGVEVLSVREPWLDTGGPVRSLLLAVFGWMAEQERAQIAARTKAGLERARRQGIRLGRPPRELDLRRARGLRAEGWSYRAIGEALGVPTMTVHRALHRPERSRTGNGSAAAGG